MDENALTVAFSTPDVTEADVAAVTKVLRSGWLTTGEVSAGLEAAIRGYTHVEHAVAVSSCTAALECALAYAQPIGRPVAVPTWTFASTANVPMRLGGVVTLIDVDRDSLMMDPDLLREFLTNSDRPAIVIPVSFAGVPIPPKIVELCAQYGATLIEDCAHSLGSVRADGSHSGTGAGVLAGALSFYATKNLTAAEGGMLLTDDDDLASFARRYRLHGLSTDAWRRYLPGAVPTYDLEMVGSKANLPDVLAALALSQFGRFETSQARRRHISQFYCDQLDDAAEVRPLASMSHPGSAHHLFVAVLDRDLDRDQVLSAMAGAGVSCSVHFQPLHTFGLHHGTQVLSSGAADDLARRVISLPLRANLRDAEAERVVEVLRLATRGAGRA